MSEALHLAFSFGIFFLGLGMVWGASRWVGMSLIIVGLIWILFCFVPNPLRKRFFIDDKTAVMVDDITIGLKSDIGFPTDLEDRILRAGISVNSIYERKIERIDLCLKGKHLPAASEHGYYFYFGIPDGISLGTYKTHIRVYHNAGVSKSKSFKIELPACH
jgi:hypothetical protein